MTVLLNGDNFSQESKQKQWYSSELNFIMFNLRKKSGDQSYGLYTKHCIRIVGIKALSMPYNSITCVRVHKHTHASW